MIQHVVAEYNLRMKEQMYRVYMSDLLKFVAEQNGAQVNYRLAELLEGTVSDDMTGDEVALDIIERAGLRTSDELI